MKDQRGMTIVELMVALVIVLVIVGSATVAYVKFLRGFKTQSRISQSYMSSLCGLEMLRYDVEMAGFGLPSSLTTGTTYSEAEADSTGPYDPASLNDATTGVPRALVSLNNTAQGGSDVLTIKSSIAGLNPVSKKWSMVTLATGAGALPKVKPWGGTSLSSTMDFTAGDRFIVLDANGALQPASSGAWTCYTFSGDSPTAGYYADATAICSGLSTQTVFFVYGLDSSASAHRMPFNRVDYFLERVAGQIPSNCAASSYTLYRSVINQQTGVGSAAPILDCVRDFQVAFGLDTDADGSVDAWATSLGAKDAATIKSQVRELRAFILYHEGGGDVGSTAKFRFSGVLNLGDPDIAKSLDSSYAAGTYTFEPWSTAALSGSPQLRSFTPAGDDLQYRWKILALTIKPMNLK
ncbi:MAG: PilW family protein [Desulfobacteraceae bacterium]|nr:PilW family protein [Desulfobacteraceae bacterium]